MGLGVSFVLVLGAGWVGLGCGAAFLGVDWGRLTLKGHFGPPSDEREYERGYGREHRLGLLGGEMV